MGVTIYLKRVRKNEHTILSHLNSLDLYDINESIIDSNITEEIIISFFQIIDEIIDQKLFSNIFDATGIWLNSNSLIFYTHAPSPISGIGYGKNSILGFNPNKIMPIISDLIIISEKYTIKGINMNEENQKLYLFKNFIERAINDDDLITLIIG